MHLSSRRLRRFRIGELLLEAGIVSPEVLTHSLTIAQRSCMPLGRVLVMAGHISDLDVDSTLQTQAHVRDGSIEFAIARELLRFAHIRQVTLEDAYKMNGICVKHTSLSRLGNLLYAAGIVDDAGVDCAVRYSISNECPLGLALVSLELISDKTLINAMNLQVLIRDGKVKFLEAVKVLRIAESNDGDLASALSRLNLDLDHRPQSQPKMGQLLVAAGLISRRDGLTILELGMESDRSYGELLVEFQLVSQNVVNAAIAIQDMFVNPLFTKSRAIRLLKLVEETNVPLEQIMDELSALQQVVSLLIASGVIDNEMIERASEAIVDNEQSVPEYLVTSGMISSELTWAALECLQAIQAGTLAYDEVLLQLSLTRNVAKAA